MKTYNELRAINVNEFTERKGQLTYLSWTYAVDILLQNDPMARWEFLEPMVYNDTMMVSTEVTALGKTLVMQLPVMDNRNNAIKSPDARKISDSQMRCLAKNIACFGIGLYIFAGSDLPEEELGQASKEHDELLQKLRDAASLGGRSLEATFKGIPTSPLKAQVWKENSKSLKELADKLDLELQS